MSSQNRLDAEGFDFEVLSVRSAADCNVNVAVADLSRINFLSLWLVFSHVFAIFFIENCQDIGIVSSLVEYLETEGVGVVVFDVECELRVHLD